MHVSTLSKCYAALQADPRLAASASEPQAHGIPSRPCHTHPGLQPHQAHHQESPKGISGPLGHQSAGGEVAHHHEGPGGPASERGR